MVKIVVLVDSTGSSATDADHLVGPCQRMPLSCPPLHLSYHFPILTCQTPESTRSPMTSDHLDIPAMAISLPSPSGPPPVPHHSRPAPGLLSSRSGPHPSTLSSVPLDLRGTTGISFGPETFPRDVLHTSSSPSIRPNLNTPTRPSPSDSPSIQRQ